MNRKSSSWKLPGNKSVTSCRTCRTSSRSARRGAARRSTSAERGEGVGLTRLLQQRGAEEHRRAPEKGQPASLHGEKRRARLLFSSTSGSRSGLVSVLLPEASSSLRGKLQNTASRQAGALPYMHFSSNRKSSEGLDSFFPPPQTSLYSQV